MGVSIVGIIREGALIANPESSARLESGDLIAVLGTREQIARFESAARAPLTPAAVNQ
jgi:K+/H+ antiporter YhaU regulatory subunit KhtT